MDAVCHGPAGLGFCGTPDGCTAVGRLPDKGTDLNPDGSEDKDDSTDPVDPDKPTDPTDPDQPVDPEKPTDPDATEPEQAV